MCNVGQAISRAFTPAGAGGLQSAQAEAEQSQATAQDALTKAIADSTQASLPLLDNASALAASKTQQQKLLNARGATWSFGGAPTAAPAVATRVLFGA